MTMDVAAYFRAVHNGYLFLDRRLGMVAGQSCWPAAYQRGWMQTRNGWYRYYRSGASLARLAGAQEYARKLQAWDDHFRRLCLFHGQVIPRPAWRYAMI